jgi:hypothetical protein
VGGVYECCDGARAEMVCALRGMLQCSCKHLVASQLAEIAIRFSRRARVARWRDFIIDLRCGKQRRRQVRANAAVSNKHTRVLCRQDARTLCAAAADPIQQQLLRPSPRDARYPPAPTLHQCHHALPPHLHLPLTVRLPHWPHCCRH